MAQYIHPLDPAYAEETKSTDNFFRIVEVYDEDNESHFVKVDFELTVLEERDEFERETIDTPVAVNVTRITGACFPILANKVFIDVEYWLKEEYGQNVEILFDAKCVTI
jgi:hypothetical protein